MDNLRNEERGTRYEEESHTWYSKSMKRVDPMPVSTLFRSWYFVLYFLLRLSSYFLPPLRSWYFVPRSLFKSFRLHLPEVTESSFHRDPESDHHNKSSDPQ